MAVTTKRGGLEVDGLAAAVRALQKVSPELKREAVEVFRDQAKDVQRRAQARIGRVGRYPRRKGMIGRSATSTGAGVKLRASKYPWALGAEYGEKTMHVHGHPARQFTLDARTMGVFNPPTSSDMGKNRGGYMIQPVIRARMPFITKDVSERMLLLYDKAFRKAGVPRGRGGGG